MRWFRASSAGLTQKSTGGGRQAGISSSFEAACAAHDRSDWAEVLLELGRLPDNQRNSLKYHELHAWALEQAGRSEDARSVLRRASAMTPPDAESRSLTESVGRRMDQRSTKRARGDHRDRPGFRFAGESTGLQPCDIAAIMELVQDLRPATLFEIGSRGGGAARWLEALTAGMKMDTRTHSADWIRHDGANTDRLNFVGGDLRKPGSIWSASQLKRAPRPWLILMRPGGGFSVTWSSLRAWHKWLGCDDVICVPAEDDNPGDAGGKRTAGDALARFTSRHPVEYATPAEDARRLGDDEARACLCCTRRTAWNAFDESASPGLVDIRRRMEAGEWREALSELNAIKAMRKSQRGADYLRALCFLNLNDSYSVCEAAKEELRYFPDHEHAAAVLASTMRRLFPGRPKMGNDEFAELYAAVRPYTMLSEERLYSIYMRTRLICQMDVPGDIVECGVAAGGASALMAATAARHSRRSRRVFSCDTFEGMPTPGARDAHRGTDAEASGWGSGTCAAPAGSLLEVAGQLGVVDRVEAVKGLFADTLPGLRERLPDGIAFLHMDGDWYESTRDILANLYDLTQARGFIQVDDYGHWEGCREAMHDFARGRGIELKVNAIDGTGVWFQRPDRKPCDLMLLNLGCGAHHHSDWVNLDIRPVGPGVIAHDLAGEPLPFDEGTCRMVYHSHVLEHLAPPAVPAFLADCHRVLAVDGVLRIAVPDLEGIAREYLRQFDAGDKAKHEWMVIELIDQLAREVPGGRMLEYWKQNPMPAEDYVFQRVGWEAKRFVEGWRQTQHPAEAARTPKAQEIGAFRMGGEPHKWMYDRLSLGELLHRTGFREFRVCTASASALENFAGYHLDADAEGKIRKPDSLFVEARK